MILGVSHITLLSKNIKADGIELQKLGYLISFLEENVPNYEGKYDFLAYPSMNHSLALYRRDNAVPIELIMYEHFTNYGSSCFTAIFEGKVPEEFRGHMNEEQFMHELTDIFECNLNFFFWDTFETKIGFSGNSARGNGLTALILFVKDLEIARMFWENGLGCNPIRSGRTKTGKTWILETFQTLLETWGLNILIVEDNNVTNSPGLDSVGFNCLSFLTTNLKLDRLRLLNTGAVRSTKEFQLKMNNKNLLVEIFCGPDAEFIELLQIKSIC